MRLQRGWLDGMMVMTRRRKVAKVDEFEFRISVEGGEDWVNRTL